jgi:TIR domain
MEGRECMKQWDVFISHASEDKKAVVIPLVDALKKAGIKAWLDQQELRIGDSLREKIDEGLVKSRFGVVIISPNFLAKSWPRKELNGLMAIEEDGQKVILPVWHNVTKSEVAQYSPILADRLAANTAQGIKSVAEEISQVVFSPDSDSPSATAPTIGRRFIEIFEHATDPVVIKDFLKAHPAILQAAASAYDKDTQIQWAVPLANTELDACVGKLQATTGRREWHFIQFETLSNQLFEIQLQPVPALFTRIQQLETLRSYIQQNLKATRSKLQDITPNFQATVVAGRREQMSQSTIDALREYNDGLIGIQVRTYDWLINAALAITADKRAL